jgi:hypothetical protein
MSAKEMQVPKTQVKRLEAMYHAARYWPRKIATLESECQNLRRMLDQYMGPRISTPEK